MVSAIETRLSALEKWRGDHGVMIQELKADTAQLKEGIEELRAGFKELTKDFKKLATPKGVGSVNHTAPPENSSGCEDSDNEIPRSVIMA
ncbi:hypothetical protein L195_g014572 [Trifolium pratense]|uniref:Uncharacterized protein n=1 Tax=Trifolium pratense TaxID=57577 RepID=A0A2K3PRA6_TRIPR|nr:hypothetical protein L195_g014572 [Trifolium pratense]